MSDDQIGTKQEVAEVKFLIHDLRVKKFVDDIIHFHATLDTDLEIHNIEQAQQIHHRDLRELKDLACKMRKAYNSYITAVKEFSANPKIIATGRDYIEKVREVCELVLNPLWGRFDQVISFLPQKSRSFEARNSYRNYLRWICGVYYRIEHFTQELEIQQLYEEFDVADDVFEFTNNVIFGYVTEKSSSKINITFENSESAVIGGNKPRYRRMFFNLVKNAVDDMLGQQNGKLSVRIHKDDKYVYLQVEDNGTGMTTQEVQELLERRQNLDGKLHSIGFVFVQQTVQAFNGKLAIISEPGKGTSVTIGVPFLSGKTKPRIKRSKCEKYFNFKLNQNQSKANITVLKNVQKIDISEIWNSGITLTGTERISEDKMNSQASSTPPKKKEAIQEAELDRNEHCGQIIFNDYRNSQAQFPGCLFAISVNYQNTLDFFSHKPYEKYFYCNHEDLSPMFYESTVRGRLENNKDKKPEVVLKAPSNIPNFFEFKKVAKKERCACKYHQMMRDEYILIARKLVNSGLPSEFDVKATNMTKYFPDFDTVFKSEPFALGLLAEQKLSNE